MPGSLAEQTEAEPATRTLHHVGVILHRHTPAMGIILYFHIYTACYYYHNMSFSNKAITKGCLSLESTSTDLCYSTMQLC